MGHFFPLEDFEIKQFGKLFGFGSSRRGAFKLIFQILILRSHLVLEVIFSYYRKNLHLHIRC